MSAENSSVVGAWVPARDVGHAAHARPWVLERSNKKWRGGREVMLTESCMVRRFKTEEAAKKAANEANSALAAAQAKGAQA